MRWTGLALFAIAFLAQACSSAPDPVFSTHAVTSKEKPSATITPSAIPPTSTPQATGESTEIPVVIILERLQATLLDELRKTATPDSHGERRYGGIENIYWKEIPNQENTWLLYSVGSRNYDPPQDHFITVYKFEDGSWSEIARQKLENSDHVNDESIDLVEMEPGIAFIEVQSAVGAHSGCYDLFNFNGFELNHLISNCASSPEAGEMVDLDGDGIKEVVLNWSEDYVFCYACGVRIARYHLWHWDGKNLVEVELSSIEENASDDAVQYNNEAVMLANAGLWKEARAKIKRAVELNNTDNLSIHWNAVLIDLIAGKRELAVKSSGFPLLNSVFYGDYKNVKDIMGSYRPNELFSNASPLINGSPAEGSEEVLYDWVNTFTDKALLVKPDLATAHFLKAWVTYLVNPTAPSIMKNLEKAVALENDEELFSDSYIFLRTGEGGE
jgi:hypothetical protein